MRVTRRGFIARALVMALAPLAVLPRHPQGFLHWARRHPNQGPPPIESHDLELYSDVGGLAAGDFRRWRRRTVEEIARAFRIPPEFLGELKAANYTHIHETQRAFLQAQALSVWPRVC